MLIHNKENIYMLSAVVAVTCYLNMQKCYGLSLFQLTKLEFGKCLINLTAGPIIIIITSCIFPALNTKG